MIKMYDFLFYCFYCLVIKKPNDESHIRSLMGLGITLGNLLIDILFLIILFVGIDLGNTKYLLIAIPLIYFIIYKLENKYYINNSRYKKSIEKYEERYSKLTKILLGLFALVLFLGSTALFIWIGITYSLSGAK